MKTINIQFTERALSCVLSLIETERLQSAEIAMATKDSMQFLKANELQNLKIDLIKIAEKQGFEPFQSARSFFG
jgi:hypothetical protein